MASRLPLSFRAQVSPLMASHWRNRARPIRTGKSIWMMDSSEAQSFRRMPACRWIGREMVPHHNGSGQCYRPVPRSLQLPDELRAARQLRSRLREANWSVRLRRDDCYQWIIIWRLIPVNTNRCPAVPAGSTDLSSVTRTAAFGVFNSDCSMSQKWPVVAVLRPPKQPPHPGGTGAQTRPSADRTG